MPQVPRVGDPAHVDQPVPRQLEREPIVGGHLPEQDKRSGRDGGEKCARARVVLRTVDERQRCAERKQADVHEPRDGARRVQHGQTANRAPAMSCQLRVSTEK